MAVGAAVLVVVKLVNPRFDQSDYLVYFFLLITSVAATAVNRVPGRETQAITRSRERVRDAERALEAALRAAQSRLGARTQVGPVEAGQAGSEESAAGVAQLALPELWAVTHRRLDLYQDIAASQARKSFAHAQAAMNWGFWLLIASVMMALSADTTAEHFVAGGFGAVSAALAGFVNRTFVKSQETAAAQLRAYFDQPLEFSRYLAAERLIAEAGLTPQQRARVLTSLVRAMVTPAAAVPVPGPGSL